MLGLFSFQMEVFEKYPFVSLFIRSFITKIIEHLLSPWQLSARDAEVDNPKFSPSGSLQLEGRLSDSKQSCKIIQ